MEIYEVCASWQFSGGKCWDSLLLLMVDMLFKGLLEGMGFLVYFLLRSLLPGSYPPPRFSF